MNIELTESQEKARFAAEKRRINRKLAHEGQRLCTSRSHGEVSNLGDHYIVDSYTNTVTTTHVDVADLAKDLGVSP